MGAVANFFIRAAKKHDRSAHAPSKLQKLIYLRTNGFHLATWHKAALFSEHIEAWDWGPQWFRPCTTRLKFFGALHIDRPSRRCVVQRSRKTRDREVSITRRIDWQDDPARHTLRFELGSTHQQ